VTADWTTRPLLRIVKTEDDPKLPPVLRDNHYEIRPGPTMSRNEFKGALKDLEEAAKDK
jgi:hypothetical protein